MRLEHLLYTIPLRVRSLFRRQRVEQELPYHFQRKIEKTLTAA